jgi:hypothetical protein
MPKTFSYSIATVSWIDARTGLPEVDKISYTYDKSTRANLTANSGYRFCNFLDVFIELAPDNRSIVRHGFYPESGIYRGPSFANIPSHAFTNKQFVTVGADAVTFRQVIGARTVSPEVIGRRSGLVAGLLWGGPFGLIASAVAGYYGGETVAHQITGFPTIWSILEIRLSSSGDAAGKLAQHSIFPSLTYYEQLDSTAVRGENYGRAFYYDARKDIELPKWKENGWGQIQGSSGPSRGNPWGMEKGVTGGDDSSPN